MPNDNQLNGQSKTHIKAMLLRLNIEYIEFVHWLAVPKLGKNLYFDKQICQAIHDCDLA